MTPDQINSGFILFAALVSCLNIKQLVKDKTLRGVSVWPTVGFTLWGIFNLYYYPYLQQWWSTVAEVAIVSVNLIWLGLVWRYKNASQT